MSRFIRFFDEISIDDVGLVGGKNASLGELWRELNPKTTKEYRARAFRRGRYHLQMATGYADVAFVIRDDFQGKGLGTALLFHLIDIAKRNGIIGFTADVLATNNAMLHVFHKAAMEIESKLTGPSYSLKMKFVAS